MNIMPRLSQPQLNRRLAALIVLVALLVGVPAFYPPSIFA